MKKPLLLLTLIILILSQNVSYAQAIKNSIMKVSYITTPLSAKMVEILKAQISDPKEYAELTQKMENIKIYHTLYINALTNESVYKTDSISKLNGLSIAGYTYSSLKDNKGNFSCKESFTGSIYYFDGKADEIDWLIGKESKIIGKYTCKKATLKSSPDVSVWFTTEIPVSNGPEFYYGLPGLVIQSDSYFETCTVSKIVYMQDRIAFNTALAKVQDEAKGKKSMSFKEVVRAKQNFITMAENKMKKNK